jgi:hypothetical protein
MLKNKTKARTLAQMAALYGVSPELLQQQIENYSYLRTELKRKAFMGDVFFPKHQKVVFQYLGEPEEDAIEIEKEKPREEANEEPKEKPKNKGSQQE